MYRQGKNYKQKLIGIGFLAFLIAGALVFTLTPHTHARNDVELTANFVGKELVPTDKFELKLRGASKQGVGSLPIILSQTDLNMFFPDANKFSYTP